MDDLLIDLQPPQHDEKEQKDKGKMKEFVYGVPTRHIYVIDYPLPSLLSR